jgi:hypothetical protein
MTSTPRTRVTCAACRPSGAHLNPTLRTQGDARRDCRRLGTHSAVHAARRRVGSSFLCAQQVHRLRFSAGLQDGAGLHGEADHAATQVEDRGELQHGAHPVTPQARGPHER